MKTERVETLNHSAAAVFAVLTDIESTPTWQPHLVAVKVEPVGPARSGSKVFETRRYAGRQSENTLTVSEFEQDRLLVLQTGPDAPSLIRSSYRIEPLSDSNCRLTCTAEIEGIPKMLELFVRQSAVKELQQNFELLRSVLEERVKQKA